MTAATIKHGKGNSYDNYGCQGGTVYIPVAWFVCLLTRLFKKLW